MQFHQANSRDSMLKRTEEKFFIINFDNVPGLGSHWVVLYNLRTMLIYFDSFGVWPPKELMKIKNLVFNDYRIQSSNSRSCGLYCIYVCDQLLAGRQFIDILQRLNHCWYQIARGGNENRNQPSETNNITLPTFPTTEFQVFFYDGIGQRLVITT